LFPLNDIDILCKTVNITRCVRPHENSTRTRQHCATTVEIVNIYILSVIKLCTRSFVYVLFVYLRCSIRYVHPYSLSR